MATTTKKQQPAMKKAATKKPAVKKKAPVKKPVKKAAATATVKPLAKDGSDRVHVKDGKVVDVVKQTVPAKKKKRVAKKAAKPRAARQTESDVLTDRELRFCREYVCDYAMNGTQAYLRAFPHVKYDTARTEAPKLLAKPCFKRVIAQMQTERTERLSVTADKIMEEAVKLAFYDPRSFFDGDNRLVPVQNLDPDHAAVIGGIETLHKITGDDTDGMAVTTKIKLPDKRGALEFLAKIKKMTSDATPIQDPRIAEVLIKARDGELTPIEGCYELQIAGLPIPRVLEIQISKPQVEVNVDNTEFSGLSTEEMERRAQERFDAVQKQRDEFLPERRAEVAEIKERLKDQDSFAPDRFEGAE